MSLHSFTALPSKSEEEVISNGTVPTDKSPSSSSSKSEKENKKSCKTNDDNEDDDIEYIEQSLPKKTDINSYDEIVDNFANDQQSKAYKQQNGIGKVSTSKLNSAKENSSKKGKNYTKADITSSAFTYNKEDAYIQRYVNFIWHLRKIFWF